MLRRLQMEDAQTELHREELGRRCFFRLYTYLLLPQTVHTARREASAASMYREAQRMVAGTMRPDWASLESYKPGRQSALAVWFLQERRADVSCIL